MLSIEDTIVAIASPHGSAARGILRMSGPDTERCLRQCLRWNASDRYPTAVSADFVRARPLGSVPCDLYFWPTSASYTRQPAAEIHTLGSPPVLAALLEAVCESGARLAEPGEFTMRAFLAGRLDLTQAEAVLGVIDARGPESLDAALRQLAGGLANPLNSLRSRLLDLLAHLEAGLDFVDEDLEFIATQDLLDQLSAAQRSVEQLHARLNARTAAADAYTVVLYGQPNAGKSSLLNALAGEATAIVSHEAGTTRDYVTRRLCLNEFEVVLVDTAGVGVVNDTVESEAQSQTTQKSSEANVRVLCVDGSRELTQWELRQIEQRDDRTVVVQTKADRESSQAIPRAIRTSSVTGVGIAELTAIIGHRCERDLCRDAEVVSQTATRCRESLRRCGRGLRRAWEAATANTGDEFVAAEIRDALEELGRVVGAVYTDDILDRVFSRFCIGK